MKIVNKHQQSGSLPALPNQIEERGTPKYLEKNSLQGHSYFEITIHSPRDMKK